MKGHRLSEETKKKIGDAHRGEKSWRWKGGEGQRNRRRRESRHKKGISKRYIGKYSRLPVLSAKIKKKRDNQIYKRRVRAGGRLTIATIQRVYEDNIKQYGTLTCYLCYKPIEFGNDSLDHKIPLSRSGTNKYENLAIAHKSCNSKKNARTEKEYKEEV